jgi:hypothetical protein
MEQNSVQLIQASVFRPAMHLADTLACDVILVLHSCAITTSAYLSKVNCFVCDDIFIGTGGGEMSWQGEENKKSTRMR